MLIYVRGVRSKNTRDRIRSCAKFCLNKLLSKRLRDKLTIYINVRTKMNDGTYGFCDPLGKNTKNGRDEYELTCVHQPISNPIHGNVYRTLAHELVHVKQFATGQMNRHIITRKTTSGKRLTGTLWEGEVYSSAKYEDSEEGYYNSPWEIEAYGREVGLYRLWKQSIGEKEDL